jgi:hypothetical protein
LGTGRFDPLLVGEAAPPNTKDWTSLAELVSFNPLLVGEAAPPNGDIVQKERLLASVFQSPSRRGSGAATSAILYDLTLQ